MAGSREEIHTGSYIHDLHQSVTDCSVDAATQPLTGRALRTMEMKL